MYLLLVRFLLLFIFLCNSGNSIWVKLHKIQLHRKISKDFFPTERQKLITEKFFLLCNLMCLTMDLLCIYSVTGKLILALVPLPPTSKAHYERKILDFEINLNYCCTRTEKI